MATSGACRAVTTHPGRRFGDRIVVRHVNRSVLWHRYDGERHEVPGPSDDVAGVTSDETSNRYNESARRPHPGADGRLRDGERQPCSDAACGYHLSVTRAGPRGEVGSLAEANEVRIVFSEPMVSLGRIPRVETAPFVRIPAVAGTFRWSGTTTLIFTPDPKRPLPFATRIRRHDHVRRDGGERRRLATPFTFTFITPAARLLRTTWSRRGGLSSAPAVVLLRFNQRVQPADVFSHLGASFEPHGWAEPSLSDDSVARTTPADPTRRASARTAGDRDGRDAQVGTVSRPTTRAAEPPKLRSSCGDFLRAALTRSRR